MKNIRPLRGLIFAALVLAALSVPAAASAAQTPTATPSASPSPSRGVQLEARLVEFPISVGPADSLAVALEVENSGRTAAEDLEVSLTIYRAVTSRSRLHQTYEGRLGTTLAVDTFPVDGVIEPGESRRIEVAKPLAELGTFRNSISDRTYPVRVVVRSGTVSFSAVNTHMVFFHELPEKPLGLSLVVPLHSASVYTDGGRPDLVTNDSLTRSITNGRLSRILEALEQHPDLPITLAPSGLLLSMLQDMQDGYPRATPDGPEQVDPEDPRALAAGNTLGRLRDLAARPNTRIITTTYSPASLPALNEFGLEELAATQLSEGRNVLLAEPLGLLRSTPLDDWLLPTFGDLDEPTLTHLHRTDFNRLIISSRSLTPSDDPFTRALPVLLEGGPGSATEGLTGVETIALVADDGLQTQIRRSGREGSIEARQRFVAESATIHLETPGLVRAVVAIAPPDWEAEDDSAGELLSAVEVAPWLNATTPDVITEQLEPPATEQVRLATSETVLENGPDLPSESYFTALNDARRAIARYSTLSPPPARIGALSRRLLIAQSTDWWSSRNSLARGLAFAEAIPPSVSAEIRKVRAPASQTITLTSRTGVIPLSVGSGLNYPVDVVLQLDSDKLTFPDGNRIPIRNLRPPTRTIQVRAITQSSGTFPLNVRLFTPSGTLISDSQLTIRSTAYNVVALSITAAAGVFIMGWWMAGWLRRRQRGDPAAAEQGVEDQPGVGGPEDPDGAITALEGADLEESEGRGTAAGESEEPAPEQPEPGEAALGDGDAGEDVPPASTEPEPAAKRVPPAGKPPQAG